MKSLLQNLGFAPPPTTERERGILAEVEAHLAPIGENAGRIAAYAALLCRVAYADDDVSAEEVDRMVEIVREHAGLDPAEAEALVYLARDRTVALAGADRQEATRRFRELATGDDALRLIDCLYAVATADDLVTHVEDQEIRGIAAALLLSDRAVLEIRSRYREQLEELQQLRALRR